MLQILLISFSSQIDEDAETRKLRIQLEEQKKLREMILKRKEARRQQLAASKQAELKKRLSAKRGKSSSESSDTKVGVGAKTRSLMLGSMDPSHEIC